MSYLDPQKRDYASLSIRDLLEAREAYHVHLSRIDTVIGTAIGRYLIRQQDPDYRKPHNGEPAPRSRSPQRRLVDSEVCKWSWPCVLVFVREWLTKQELQNHPEQVIPSFLYLPDGRIIPTCVVKAELVKEPRRLLDRLNFPSKLVGGGYPVLTQVQGEQHVGSLGCLVSDGDNVYMLTNQHVSGEAGREAFTLVNGGQRRLGAASTRQVGKKPFNEVYQGYPTVRAFSNLDAGLIKLDEASGSTAQVFGIGELGDLIDLNVNTMTLDLIGMPVRAWGGVSGELKGSLKALFYRYRSVGGFDYVADLLIGPRDKNSSLPTEHGDSGTVWFYDPEGEREDGSAKRAKKAAPKVERGIKANRFRPLALQWGGQKLQLPGTPQGTQFALATTLSTVCRELDVTLVSDLNIGQTEYWGRLGHFKIAAEACQLVTNQKLKTLLTNNLDRISFSDNDFANSDARAQTGVFNVFGANQFVPLADVPDLAWKKLGHPANRHGKDNSTHFADVDAVSSGPNFTNKSLLTLTQNINNLDPDVWDRFYDELIAQGNSVDKGSLPFRVWQFYQELVGFAQAQQVADFVCAAGILAHYVGDACQPLHASEFFNTPSGVHTMYETTMLDSNLDDLLLKVDSAIGNQTAHTNVSGGRAAAASIMQLIRDVRQVLLPQTIGDFFQTLGSRNRARLMWAEFGDRTAQCMALGSLRLASLWQSAWVEGGGNQIANNRLVAINKNTLRGKYTRQTFLESFSLRQLADQNILQ